jgi:hypothetical protein
MTLLAVLLRPCRRLSSDQRRGEALDKQGSWQSIYDSYSGISRQAGNWAVDAALIRSGGQHGSELANWNFDENRQLSQILYSFHKDFDTLDG